MQLNNVNRKHSKAPMAAAIGSCVTLEHSLQPTGISCMMVSAEGGKVENRETNPPSREENQHKLNPLMASGPEIEPGPHCWQVSALTTAPPLLPGLCLGRIVSTVNMYVLGCSRQIIVCLY